MTGAGEKGAAVYGAAQHEVRRLQIRSSALATAIFTGEYKSAFRGRGMEFEEVREYLPGDDVRAIDWKVTARQGRPFVKRYVEERQITVVLVIDRSPSMRFGTVRSTKLEAATEAAALLAFAALRSHDRTALISTGDGQVRYLQPGKGRKHTMRLVAEAITPGIVGVPGNGLEAALQHLERVLKGRAVVCIFSDFVEPVPVRAMASLAARHDVVAGAVSDPAERELPRCGVMTLRDPRNGSLCRLDGSDAKVRAAYQEVAEKSRLQRRGDLAKAGAAYLELGTEGSPLHPLIAFFQSRRGGRAA